MTDNKYIKKVIEFLGLVLGCIFLSTGLNMFLGPHTIAPGGLSGLSLVISQTTGISMSVIMLGVGIPLLLCSMKILGRVDFIKTLLGMSILSLFLEITSPLSQVIVTEDVLLSGISGAILVGLGLGIVFRVDGSTGGTDLIALILHRLNPKIPVAKYLTVVDGLVVLSAGLVSKNLETTLYSGIALFVIVKVIDAIVEGFDYSKAFMIITEKEEELRNVIVGDMNRGVTILEARGGYTNNDKSMLLVVVKRPQESNLKKLVKQIDPKAFIIVSDVHEVLGEGFTEIVNS